ncbi:MAG: GntR family transcriptional regulator, partial [Terracidiphilus sp.]
SDVCHGKFAIILSGNMKTSDISDLSTGAISNRIWHGAPRENLATRVANAIREQLQSGQLASGVQLRGEVEFARELGVSRQTLREATRVLTREGLLTIRHGVGTFVAEASEHLSSSLNTIGSLSTLIHESGAEARVDGLKVRRIAATAQIAKALDINLDSDVAEITRLRLIGARPLAVAYDYIPLLNADLEMPLIKTFDGESIYRFMATRLKRQMKSSEATISAVSSNKKHAQLLRVKVGFPLLLMREVQFDAQHLRGLYSEIFHNSSLMEFTLARPEATP